MSATFGVRDRRMRVRARRARSLFMVAVTTGMVACGSQQMQSTVWEAESSEHAAFREIRATIGDVEQLIVTEPWRSVEDDRLQSEITSANAALDVLEAECRELAPQGGCTGLSSPAAEHASDELLRSLGQLSVILAYPRKIIPPDPPPDDPSDDPCHPMPKCPHKGGDAHHNWCADSEPPNVHPGCDVLVNGKHFDALTSVNVLWEVKTERWSEFNDYLRPLILGRYRVEARVEHAVALSCGYPFVFGVADAGLYEALRDDLRDHGIQHIPRCVRE